MAVAKLVLLLLCHLLLLLLVPEADSKCPKSYPCGNFSLEFPFTITNDPDCGLFIVDNCDSKLENPILLNRGQSSSPHHILAQTSSNEFLIEDEEFEGVLKLRECVAFPNLSQLPQSPFVSFTFSPNITLFTCYNQTPEPHIHAYFQTYRHLDCKASTVYYKTPPTHHDHASDIPQGCQLSQLPIKSEDSNSTELLHLLTPNFTLEWNVSPQCYECYRGGGQCYTDSQHQFYCSSKTGNRNLKKILFIGGMTIAALTSTLVFLFICIRRMRATAKQEHEKDIELFLKSNGNLAPMRYKYSSIKKMTKSFSHNLGKGGYGSVYKGQFPDGQLMAVKVLNESNGNGEDFMNEVASISRTSHINIVALLGFCYEGCKRALIYDFMPNGSLEKFIGNNAESALGWEKLFEIALGIARGLEYLHQGCSTRILHLDIKPQNILLDKDMNPRISDFGLAKLCPNRSSVVSMMVARGTIGYIAPEVFSRNFGEVSYKSDVYSYGMLVLDMVGGRRNIERREVDRTSEIYFSHYIYKQLEENAERDGDIAEITDDGDERHLVKRNLMIVGLWCIQTNPTDRPTMTKVIEMLEGKLGTLEVPPKPYLYSPPRSAPSFSISESL